MGRFSGIHGVSDTDTGQFQYPDYSVALHTAPATVRNINGCETWKTNRRPSQSDVDMSPYLIRRFTNMSMTDVQLINGLQHGIASGRRIPYQGSGYLYASAPIIPGQTRDNVAGFHRRGPSPYNVADVFTAGPGAQPNHPEGGGPGKIAAPIFYNPMSG